MTLEQQSNNVRALIDYRNAVADPVEGLKILLKCAQEFKDVDLVPLKQELLDHGPTQFIIDNLPDPFGTEEAFTESFSYTTLLTDETFRKKYEMISNMRKLHMPFKEPANGITPKYTPRLSTSEEEVLYLEYMYDKLQVFWFKLKEDIPTIVSPSKAVMEAYLDDLCGIEYKTLINSGVVLTTFQELLKCQNRQEKLVVIRNSLPRTYSRLSKERSLAFIIGLGDWGDEVHNSLRKFGYSLIYSYDYELAIMYLLKLESAETGRKNLEWINGVFEQVLDVDECLKRRFAMPGDRGTKKKTREESKRARESSEP